MEKYGSEYEGKLTVMKVIAWYKKGLQDRVLHRKAGSGRKRDPIVVM